MASNIRSRAGLIRLFGRCQQEVQHHFEHLPGLVSCYPMDVALAYAFQRLELGQNMALYCGVLRLHKANSAVARSAINTDHMTRELFAGLYKVVFDVPLPEGAKTELKSAESTRDDVMHGRPASDDRLRNAIGGVLEFAEAVNRQLHARYQLDPFCGDWRGVAGRLQKLDKRTTKFMLKGMGFPLK